MTQPTGAARPRPMEMFQRMRGEPAEKAGFFWWHDEAVPLGARSWHVGMFSGIVAFETDAGLVLVDSGLSRLAPQMNAVLRKVTQAPVHTAIFTQGHVDHAYGLESFLLPGQAPPCVIAHEAMPKRFDRYRRTAMMNAYLNARQFRGDPDGPKMNPDDFKDFREGYPSIQPNVLYRDRLDIRVGGVEFQIHHCLGETDDHSWIFCPERGVLCPGDLFIWSTPNAGNPQKVQRYVRDWAIGLRTMAACEPRHLAPGHGGPVVEDPAKVREILTDTADYLDAIHDGVVAALNDGAPPHVDIVHSVKLPVSAKPWLQPLYDDPEFIARNIIRQYAGWWTGRPSELKPSPRDVLATKLCALMGGVAKVLDAAEAEVKAGDLRLARHLADYALEATPEDKDVQARVAAIYDTSSDAEPSLMGRNIFTSAAVYARAGRAYR